MIRIGRAFPGRMVFTFWLGEVVFGAGFVSFVGILWEFSGLDNGKVCSGLNRRSKGVGELTGFFSWEAAVGFEGVGRMEVTGVQCSWEATSCVSTPLPRFAFAEEETEMSS